MERAIALARQGAAKPGMNPIGCVIVRDGQIIGATGLVECRARPCCYLPRSDRRRGKRCGLFSHSRSRAFFQAAAKPGATS
jgi:hypothetical protein